MGVWGLGLGLRGLESALGHIVFWFVEGCKSLKFESGLVRAFLGGGLGLMVASLSCQGLGFRV